jgi:phosphoribosylformylglycinamidine synthase PurS subunit
MTERLAEFNAGCWSSSLSLFSERKLKLELQRIQKFARPAQNFSAKLFGARMKAKIIITPKKAVLDPQGKTVQTALAHMGYTGVTGVHIGKYIEIDLAPGTDKAAAHKALNDAAFKLLSNPVIEDYRLEIE